MSEEGGRGGNKRKDRQRLPTLKAVSSASAIQYLWTNRMPGKEGNIVGGSAGKESSYSSGNLGLTPGLGRSPGEGKGHPFKHSGLENSMDCIVHEVAKNHT